ncbi:MAG: type II toxin-antitoxin system RelB/DinJ family antitoxin [Lachnospiraceae bacterium]|nr:type II toxin-antitoxin system RelB/DinJ family antitoxin [Lachnospiraceae bacterium]MBD5505138.1 type II toxin-antitoxin system RelB/DinJ family antitoxin [Lachnospiraceae bacterium]
MAQATFSVRMDETLKRQFDTLCSDFGMTASTAINVFARAVVRERKIPFEIVSPEPEITREKAMQAFMELRLQSEKNFPEGMSLEEINEEIRKARYDEEEAE